MVELVAEDPYLLDLEGLGAELVEIVVGDEHFVVDLLHVLKLEPAVFKGLFLFLEKGLLLHQLEL